MSNFAVPARAVISRRTLAAGAAWATPAIVLGAGAPYASASALAACVGGAAQLAWNADNTTMTTVSQFPDALQGATPLATDGRLINRRKVTATPTNLVSCTNPDLTLSIDTSRQGHAFDSYTCVPGWDYLTQDPTNTCATIQGAVTGGSGGYQKTIVNPADPLWANSQWRDGANLRDLLQAPNGDPNVAGTPEGFALGWNSYNNGGTSGSGGTGWNNRTVWTFTFSQAVTNLKFNLYDIDYANFVNNPSGDTSNTGVRELVYFDAGGTMPTSTGTRGSNVTGSGTYADPWKPVANGNLTANDPTAGITGITFANVTQFKIVAWSDDTAHRTSENIFLSNLSFDCPTGC